MPKNVDLKSTLNLPRTDFPMKAGLPQNEPKQLAEWEEKKLYHRIQRARAGAPSYVLHDGPPYPTGTIHLGTALNKILKDLVVKSKTMAGFRAPYLPGWDCHGLPIEYKVVKESRGLSPLEVRPKQEAGLLEHWRADCPGRSGSRISGPRGHCGLCEISDRNRRSGAQSKHCRLDHNSVDLARESRDRGTSEGALRRAGFQERGCVGNARSC